MSRGFDVRSTFENAKASQFRIGLSLFAPPLCALRRQSDVALQRYWLLLRHVRFDELKLLVDIDMTVHLLICRDLQRSNPC